MLPGLPGSYLRAAFYRLTLRECSLDISISLGTYFAYAESAVGPHVAIGAYCVLGRVSIGPRTQIASHVQITTGRRQHGRDEQGRITEEDCTSATTRIGPDCWIGASAIVMADVGAGTTIGAGTVVTQDLPSHVTAIGNPARVIQAGTAAQR